LFEKIVKSKLALKGMGLKDLATTIGESYSSVHEVLHDKWGKNGKVARRIRRKISLYLDIPELSKGGKK
jgi:lambda repressor-like predicted transcriptional regulator